MLLCGACIIHNCWLSYPIPLRFCTSNARQLYMQQPEQHFRASLGSAPLYKGVYVSASPVLSTRVLGRGAFYSFCPVHPVVTALSKTPIPHPSAVHLEALTPLQTGSQPSFLRPIPSTLNKNFVGFRLEGCGWRACFGVEAPLLVI